MSFKKTSPSEITMHLEQGISLFDCEIWTSLVTELKIRCFLFVSSEISENGTFWKTLDKKATEHFFAIIRISQLFSIIRKRTCKLFGRLTARRTAFHLTFSGEWKQIIAWRTCRILMLLFQRYTKKAYDSSVASKFDNMTSQCIVNFEVRNDIVERKRILL